MIGFYGQNEGRAYPFVTTAGPPSVPPGLVVDCGFVAGPTALADAVRLQRVERSGGVTTLTFVGEPADAEPMTFAVADADGQYAVAYDTVGTADDVRRWDAYVVFGRPWEVLPDEYEAAFGPDEAVVEPALVQTLRGRVVTGVQCANTRRLTVTPPTVCVEPDGSGSSVGLEEAVTYGGPFAGHVKLKPGYNCRIDVRPLDNSITIGGSVGGGAGAACEDVPAYDGESPPAGSPFLSGGPACSDLIKTINGATGPVVDLAAGAGFQLIKVDENTLRVVADTIR